MISEKIQKWLENGIVPQRVLLSGDDNNLEIAIKIASDLQGIPEAEIANGSQSDTLIFRDNGKSWKIDYSESAKKDNQGEEENSRGLINWIYKKPTAKYRIIILENLERSSISAVNCLLKIIEEPPKNAILLFTTKNHYQLLETIISRITVVRTSKSQKDFVINDDVNNFLSGKNLLQNFIKIEELDKESKNNADKKINRTVIFDFLEECIRHSQLFTQFHQRLEILYETYDAIKKNLNVRFCLERMIIKNMEKII